LNYFNSLSVAESSAPGTDMPLPNGNIEQVFDWKKISNLEGNADATSTGNFPQLKPWKKSCLMLKASSPTKPF